MTVVQPTFFPTASKVLVKLYQKIQAELKAARGCKYWFVDKCVNQKLDWLEQYGTTTSFMHDKLIFSHIKAMTGGKMKFLMHTGEKVSEEILKFLKICLCVDILEAYCSAETSGVACISVIGDNFTGSTGGPICCTAAKLKLMEDFNPKDKCVYPTGELLLQGPTLLQKYFCSSPNDNLKDGWLHTGDLAVIYPNGAVQLLGRIANTFKLLKEENEDQSLEKIIIPEKIENILIQSELITRAFVPRDDERSFVYAIVQMDSKQLEYEFKLRSKTVASVDDLLNDQNFKKEVIGRIT